MDYMEKVSKRIVELREAAGETQQELADAIGITRQSLSRYEIASRTINVDVLGALAEHYNVSADYLLGLSDVKSTEQDIKTACEITGLSEKAIENISNSPMFKPTWYKEHLLPVCTAVLESETFYYILRKIDNVVSSTEFERAFNSNEERKIKEKYGADAGTYVRCNTLLSTKKILNSTIELFPTGHCVQTFESRTIADKFELESTFKKMYENIIDNLISNDNINKIIERAGDYDISEYIEKIFKLETPKEEVTSNAQHNPEEE